MQKSILFCLLIGLTACSGAKSTSNEAETTETLKNIPTDSILRGQWMIENIVENDSSYVRPSEIVPESPAYINFNEDDTFGIITNCNHLGGRYILSNDSLKLTEISTTEMACDNMDVEEMLKKILPIVNTVDCLNDSITRLNSAKGDSYIVLKKNKTIVK